MTQEDKRLLLKDLSARLPYGVKVYDDMGRTYTLNIGNSYLIDLFYENGDYVDAPIKPYFRPMSSMTEEEKEELRLTYSFLYSDYPFDDEEEDEDSIEGHYEPSVETFDWYNKKMFDYRGLIPKGLAIEVTKENNPYKT